MAVLRVARQVGLQRSVSGAEVVLQVVRGQICLNVVVLQIFEASGFLGLLELLVNNSYEFSGSVELVGATFGRGVGLTLLVVVLHDVERNKSVVVLVVDFVVLLQGGLQSSVGAPHDGVAQHGALELRLQGGFQQALREPRDLSASVRFSSEPEVSAI